MSSNSALVFEYNAQAGAATTDDLFLERLDTFMDKCLGDIKAFSERESRPYEETRRCIAQWHAKYLFQPSTLSSSAKNRTQQVRSILCDASRILESLSETTGVQSFLLAVDPKDISDGGFLGGSVTGREFWRGLRGGGDSGARLFKSHCKAGTVDTPPPKGGAAKSTKNELYESVRNALRVASGIRSAEMKWTNPERLDVYGVRLVGWPEGVPAQNPSTLKVGQNKLLLDAIQSGSMKFERVSYGKASGDDSAPKPEEDVQDEDFSWAYDADACPSSPPPGPSTGLSSNAGFTSKEIPTDTSNARPDAWDLDVVTEADKADTSYSVDYSWDGDFRERMIDTLGEEWSGGESHLQPERPRKRQRSEEIFSVMDN